MCLLLDLGGWNPALHSNTSHRVEYIIYYVPCICHVYTWYMYCIYTKYTIHMNYVYNVYTDDIPCSIYKEYAWYITGISHLELYITYYRFILRIFMVYHRYIIIKNGTEQTHFYFTRYIPSIWMTCPYAFDMPCIYHVYTMYVFQF